MRAMVLVVASLGACGDNLGAPIDAAPIDAALDAPIGAGLFGEACDPGPNPIAERACRDETSALNYGVCVHLLDGTGGGVCRPWCCYSPGSYCTTSDPSTCSARGGVEFITSGGSCVCVPPES